MRAHDACSRAAPASILRFVAQVVPYPFDLLPRIARQELAPLRRAARLTGPRDPERIALLAKKLLGAPLRTSPMSVESCEGAELDAAVSEPLVAALFETEAGARGVLELDPRLGACLIDRVLGGEGGARVPFPAAGLHPVEAGTLAYLLARIAAEAKLGFFLRAVLNTPAAMRAALGEGSLYACRFTVELGEDRGVARLWLPAPSLEDGPTHATELSPILAGVALEVPVLGGRATLSARELGGLRVGDALLLDEVYTRPGPAGDVRCVLGGGRRAELRASIEAGRLVFKDIQRRANEARTKGRPMSESESRHDPIALAGDAPVELTVELARFTLTLEELARVRPGEVLATGRRIGERIALRAGERTVALCELVEIEGEVGVRVLKLGA